MMTEQLVMWKKMTDAAEKRFLEALADRGDEHGARDIAHNIANEIAREFLCDAVTFTAFLADDYTMLWRAMEHKENCETVQDVLFDFAEGDLFIHLERRIPAFTHNEDEEGGE